ncbi:MAG TPA: M20/M25/M40 family metallo-hydrolase [Verrucomicrobiae bacterium]|nr:M20/M25/M40 family metallo-hydrolase [Verrucomicrobiae bacterium]
MIRLLAAASVCAVAFAQSAGDLDVLAKMKTEAFDHSQAQPVFDMFTITIGPRLTGSPAEKRAAEWARDWLTSQGLADVHLEPWKFGRGWELQKLTLEMTEPRYTPLIGYADAWSPSTAGEVVGTPVYIGGKSADEVAAMKEQLKGAIVLTQPPVTNFIRQNRGQPTDPDYTAPPAATGGRGAGRGAGRGNAQRIPQILFEAGAAAILKPSRGEHGTVFVQGRDAQQGALPNVTLSGEHYNMLVEMVQHKVAVKVRVNVQTRFPDEDNGNSFNVIAELPGTDPAVKDEAVMIGGHLDCWHSGVGAADNADGATTVMEAMRILKASGVRPRRTIRVAVWSGEEQGLYGSKAWVAEHLAGDANRAAREKFDVYFNVDAGSGPIYGWYLQQQEAVRARFDAWLAPLKAAGMRRNVIDAIGNSDHVTFHDAGVPGFNAIQDYSNYDIRVHHTNMDLRDRVDIQDVRQSALVTAWFAYQAAQASEKIPRAKTN